MAITFFILFILFHNKFHIIFRNASLLFRHFRTETMSWMLTTLTFAKIWIRSCLEDLSWSSDVQSQAKTIWQNSRWYNRASSGSHFLLCFWKSSPGTWWQNAQNGEHHSIIRAWSSSWTVYGRIPLSCLVQSTTKSLLHGWERPPNYSSSICQVYKDKS